MKEDAIAALEEVRDELRHDEDAAIPARWEPAGARS
jgi:hypothetical protein